MLFSPAPKDSREDLYDREEELDSLLRFLNNPLGPLALILGLRRTGKTSLLKVALKEHEGLHLVIDLRKAEEQEKLTYRSFIELLQDAINNISSRKWRSQLLQVLRAVRGVEIHGFKVYLAWGGRNRVSLPFILEQLNELAAQTGTAAVLVFDEAQELARIAGYRIDRILAYAYDHLRHLKIILTGSKIGLLYRFIGRENPEAPLFGRATWDIELAYFTKQQSLEFLQRGFEQVNIKVDQQLLHQAVERLNGVPGWLTLFGYLSLQKPPKTALKQAERTAATLLANELENFLKLRPQARKRYLAILKAIAQQPGSWSQIKRAAEAILAEPIPPKNYTTLLHNLQDAGFIAKTPDNNYHLTDTLLAKALAKIK